MGVLLGNGDGTFQVAQTYDSGANGARGVAVADVNGDGKLDVLVANSCASGIYCDGNSNTGSVAVLLGRGDGSLRRARVYSAGGLMAGYIVLGDFNGDSKLDVAIGEACGCGGHRKIAVLLGNGDGTLQSAQSYDLPGEPQGITAGDLNGDGAPDLVVGVQAEGQQSGSVAVLLGNGDGSFQKSMVAGAGVSPVLDDVNGDGKLDLVVAACGDPKCSKGGVGILLGNGDGSFQAVQVYSSGGVNANFVALGDVNRDGKHDVFVANYSGKVGSYGSRRWHGLARSAVRCGRQSTFISRW